MNVGVLSIEILIPGSSSLKDKRMVLNRIKDRVRAKYNVSVAEVDFQDKWQRAALGFAQVGNNKKIVEESLNTIFRQLDQDDHFEIINYQLEVL
jgi:uncharacterized protein YlxP (DUF503 family)